MNRYIVEYKYLTTWKQIIEGSNFIDACKRHGLNYLMWNLVAQIY